MSIVDRKYWMIITGHHGDEHDLVQRLEYFVDYSNAIDRRTRIRQESHDHARTHALLAPIEFHDIDKDAQDTEIDSKNCWMVSLIDTNDDHKEVCRYFVSKDSAITEAIKMYRTALDELSDVSVGNRIEPEVENCRKLITAQRDNEGIVYDDELFDTISIYIERLPFQDA